MSLLLLSLVAYLYAFWCAYVLVMGIYRAHLAHRLVGLNKVLALPVVAVGYFMDVADFICERLLDVFDPTGDHC